MKFSEKFRRGRGVIFNPKIYIADFCHFIDDTSVMNFGKNLQYDFPKMRGGGSNAVWFFSKNSSVLEVRGFPNSDIDCDCDHDYSKTALTDVQ